MDISKLKVVALAASLALAACASDSGLRTEEKRALYQSHAGEPVSSFRYFGSINGWSPLGDSALVVWTRPSEAWLLTLQGPCPDLEFAPAIGLTSQMNQVHARFDKVIAHGAGSMQLPCHIREIRPLDVKALRASEKELREARVQEREADSGS
ncbi:DUF6491 family protein [uncultured Luteimonas sp.]|uniref:DUF6491 family protein n=1 Tax=uncultured Luteimonas sp. TaxID=453144 RepID=UPI002625F3E5|nr:DUF6491 family protein [uncultured Luteimonas sp.]